MDFYYLLIVVFAVCIDGFSAGSAYGLQHITIPPVSLAIIGAATLFYAGVATYGCYYISGYLSVTMLLNAGSIIMFGLGLTNILRQYYRDSAARHMRSGGKMKKFTLSIGMIVIDIMLKPERADLDRSQRINAGEAVFLATALGIDNMVAIFAAGLMRPLPYYTPIMMCLIQTMLIYSGIVAGKYIPTQRLGSGLSYCPGIILILIGLARFIPS